MALKVWNSGQSFPKRNARRSKNNFTNQVKASYLRKFTTSTFNKLLPSIKNVIDKDWHITSIHEILKKTFDKKKTFIACRKNKDLHQIIGGKRILK